MNYHESENTILKEVILGYRSVINDRYQYHHIRSKYNLPPSFDENRVDLFRKYFLNYIYPHPDKREELNDAFSSLDDYIKHPVKLLRILLDSGKLLFKYGRHLPKILKAGIKTFESYRAASRFEEKLVQEALASNIIPPYQSEDIYALVKSLARRDIENFIENSSALFETLYDRVLIREIKEIVEHLISKMKQRPNVYSKEEIRGLEIGRDIIKEGDFLFDQLNSEEQRQIFEFIIKIERSVLEELYS